MIYKIFLFVVVAELFLFSLSAFADLKIMSYNIKDFWLRFDGEPSSITTEGATLNQNDLEKLEIIAGVINKENPDVAGILECASLAELLFFNE